MDEKQPMNPNVENISTPAENANEKNGKKKKGWKKNTSKKAKQPKGEKSFLESVIGAVVKIAAGAAVAYFAVSVTHFGGKRLLSARI